MSYTHLSFFHHKLWVTAGKAYYILSQILVEQFCKNTCSVSFWTNQCSWQNIWNIRQKSEENNSGNLKTNVLSMTSIWFDIRIKLPTIKKYFLYWTLNWWYGDRCGNGFLLCGLQFSIYDVNVLKVHRSLPATWRERRVYQEWKKLNRFSSLLVLWYFIMKSVHFLLNESYLQHQATYF